MAMENYYEIFNLDMNATNEEIGKRLYEEKKKWIHRQNAANPEKRQEAERMIALIERAGDIFSDSIKRQNYDMQVLKAEKKKGAKGQQQSKPAHESYQQPEPVAQPYSGESLESVEECARTYYETNNQTRAIQYIMDCYSRGYRSAALSYYLGMSYYENGETDHALAVLRQGQQQYPDASFLAQAIASILLFSKGDLREAGSNLQLALKLDPDNSNIKALVVLYRLISGQGEQADQLCDTYLKSHPEDEIFRAGAANAYLQYADQFLVQSLDGRSYLESQEAFDSVIYYRKKAYELYPNSNTKAILADAEGYGKKVFNKENIIAIGALFLLGSCIHVVVGILLAAVVAFFSYRTQWQLLKEDCTGKRHPVDTVCYIIRTIASYVLKVYWFIIKFIFYVLLSW